MSETLYCGFCDKSQHDVATLIAGPTVFICDECIALCAEIVAKRNPPRSVYSPDQFHARARLARAEKPRKVRAK